MAVFAWSSLAGGFFSGRIRRDRREFEDYFLKLAVDCYGVEANFQRMDRAEKLAARKGVSLTQIALAYVLNGSLNLYALVGCQNGDEFRELAAAEEIELTQQEVAYLNLESAESA